MRFASLAVLACCWGLAWGQCTIYSQTSCGSVYQLNGGTLPANSPTLATFLAQAWANFQSVNATTARLPQPKITLTAQNWPCMGPTLRTGVALYGPKCQPFAARLGAAGITTQDYNIWQLAMASSMEYQTEGLSAPYNIAGDCVGMDGPGGAYLTKGHAPSASSGPHCWALYYYDVTFAYLAAQGWTLRAGDPQMTDDMIACGLTPASQSGTITIAQYQSCLIPLHYAEIKRWPTITAFQIEEEPLGGMANVQTFSVADTSTFIVADSAALKAINSNGLLIGVAGTGISYLVNGIDTAYWTDWTNTAGATWPALDFFVIDLFAQQCDLSTSNTKFPGQPYYAAELANWAGQYVPASGKWGYIAAVKTANAAASTSKPVRIGQTDAPVWCPTTGTCQSGNAILGQYDAIWDSSGFFGAWAATMASWASANGIQSVSVFYSAQFENWSWNQSIDNAGVQSGAAAMANLTTTDALTLWGRMNGWWQAKLTGRAALTGRANLTHR